MNCWHCHTPLIWGSDGDLEEWEPGADKYAMVTYLHCPNCLSHVEVYYPKEDDDEEDNVQRVQTNDAERNPSEGVPAHKG